MKFKVTVISSSPLDKPSEFVVETDNYESFNNEMDKLILMKSIGELKTVGISNDAIKAIELDPTKDKK